MAKIIRKTQKIFANNANAGDISAMGTMKTGSPVHSTDLDVLQNNNYLLGWDSALKADKAPYLEEMNAVQYGITRQLAYLYQQGIAEWDSNTTYYTGSYVTYNNKIYVSKTNDNTGHAISETTYWQEYGIDFMNKDFSNATSQPWLTMLNALFPVGAIYCGKMTNCPLENLIPGSIWQKVAQDRCLQGAGTLYASGSNVTQGLPGFGGWFSNVATGVVVGGANFGGAFANSGYVGYNANFLVPAGSVGVHTLNFDAVNGNSTYSEPNGRVQQYAYVTNIWERVA